MRIDGDILKQVDDRDIIDGEFVIPAGIKTIGKQAFQNCESLTEIVIPETITNIGDSAFWGCKNLSKMTIPKGVTNIGDYAFGECKRLTKINIPEGVTEIREGLFYECNNLSQITIPKNINNIGLAAFTGCESLTEIAIPEGVTHIGQGAFELCKSLSRINIPDSVIDIGRYATFLGCKSLTEITIPKGITEIGESVFEGCENLSKVTIPEEVKKIKSSAFKNCNNLSEIAIPESVTEIGGAAFSGCNSLQEIILPKNIDVIGDYTFNNCSSLTKIVIPEDVINIGLGAFSGCSSLSEITIPEGVERINDDTFKGCENLLKIKIPERVVSIGTRAFKDCGALSDVLIPESVDIINPSAFEGCSSLSEIILPKNIDVIGDYTFNNCSSLTKIMIPEGVINIGLGAFSGCSSLASIKIPEQLSVICKNTFKDCGSLSEIIIPKSLKRIDDYAFEGCSSLTEVTIPMHMSSISGNAFNKCTNLERINVIKENTEITDNHKYLSIDGVLYLSNLDESQKVVQKYPEGKKDISSYIFPDGTVQVFSQAFEGCSGLKEIIIPNNIRYDAKAGFTYNNIEYDKDREVTILKNEQPSKSSKYIPETYLSYLLKSSEIKSFISNSDFRAFNSNIPNLKEMLQDYSDEEKLDFFKFAVCLGCFSNEKFLDKNLKETEFTVGQKASALLAKLIKTPQLKLGEYHGLFDSLPFEAKSSQELIKFLTPQGKKNDNLELLTSLEHDCPGIFAKVVAGFDEAKEYRNTLAEDGTTKVLPWEEALKKFYSDNKYIGITENTKDIAKVYSSKGLKQDVFDKGVKLREKAEEMNVPENILGTSIRELSILEKIEQLKQQTADELSNSKEIIDELYDKQFTYEWLNKNDPKNGIMGLYVSCCGTITSAMYGRYIAESSITQKDVQNLVIRDAKGEIISKGTIYVNEEHGYGLFNDFELNQKYRAHENRSNGYGGVYAGDDKDESELSESEKNQRKERDLIFSAFQRGISSFVEEYDKQHPDKPLQQINVGMGYNRLKRNVEQFEKATKLLTAPTEYSFEDAKKGQYILYKREEKEKTNTSMQEKEER